MFISISFSEKKKLTDDLYQLAYVLEDTTGSAQISLPIESHIYDSRGDASVIPSGLIHVYSKWKQNVPRNLAMFYSQTFSSIPNKKEQLSFMMIDKIWTDTYCPELEYGKKYYNCTVNQLDVLRYTGYSTYFKHA